MEQPQNYEAFGMPSEAMKQAFDDYIAHLGDGMGANPRDMFYAGYHAAVMAMLASLPPMQEAATNELRN
ncbi:MAG: hypothetical protein JHC38_00880 [Thiotrichales bacterium]|nr:hypothetical protein [Thiotrichales bacterium]